MLTECVCEVEGCGERGRFKHGTLPDGWLMILSFEKVKPSKKIPRFPVELDDMAFRDMAQGPRMRKRAICPKHEMPKFVIYTGDEDDGMMLGAMHGGM